MNQLNFTNLIRPEAFQTRISNIVRAETLRQLGNPEGPLLDVGCGNGIFALEYSAGQPQHRVVLGLDYDLHALQNARQIFSDNQLDPTKFIRGNAYQLPFRDNSFEVVFCLNTLVNFRPFSRIEGLIRELHRICRPGGRIIFDYRNDRNPVLKLKYLKNRISKTLVTNGHTLKQFRPIFSELKVGLLGNYPLGSKNPFLAFGFLTILEK